MMIYDQLCLRHHEADHLSLLKPVEGVICESRLQQIAHTVKFTKLAKYDYSEEIAHRTESEIGNSINKTTGENRFFFQF